jgi:hypothetical protein
VAKVARQAVVAAVMAVAVTMSGGCAWLTRPGIQSSTHSHSRKHKTDRDLDVRDEFRRMTGHPNGWPGHVVDHIEPLCAGGADAIYNMQWQTVEEAKIKDQEEYKLCDELRRERRRK